MSLPSSGETKYQNLTPVPPIPPPPSLSYNHHPHHPPPGHHPPVPPPHHAGPPPQSPQHNTGHPHGIYHPGHPPWSHNMAYPTGPLPPPHPPPPGSHTPFMPQQQGPPPQQLQPTTPHQQAQPPPSPLSTGGPPGSAQSSLGMSLQAPLQSSLQGQPPVQSNVPPSSHPLGFLGANSGNSGPVPPQPHQQQQHGPPIVQPPSSQQPQQGGLQQSQIQPGQGGGPTITNSENTPSNGEKVTKKKRKRCGDCPGCLKKDNCGECGPCKSVRSHQICKMRKCDQLKTKKEKTRDGGSGGRGGESKISSVVQDGGGSVSGGSVDGGGPGSRPNSVPGPGSVSGSGSRPGSSSINGTSASSSPFIVNSNDGSQQHYPPPPSGGVGGANITPGGQAAAAPRSFPEFGPKHWPPMNPMYNETNPVEGASPYNNYAGHPMTTQTGPYNGDTIGGLGDVKTTFDDGLSSGQPGVPQQGGPDTSNRHQMTNNRLKSLIQNRQSSKGGSGSNGPNNRSTVTGSSGQPPSQPAYPPNQQSSDPSINFAGANYGTPINQQQQQHQGSSGNSYINQGNNSAGAGLPGRVPPTTLSSSTTNSDNTPQTYVQMNWTTSDAQGNGDVAHPPSSTTPSTPTTITGGDIKPGRRTPFGSLESPNNGFSFGANSYSQYERNTPSESTYSADGPRGQQTQQPSPQQPQGQQPQQQQSRPASNGNGHQYIPQFGNNQSQQYSPLHRQQHSDSSNEVPSFTNSQSHTSATLASPGRSKTPSSTVSGGQEMTTAPNTNNVVNSNGSPRDPLSINNNATNSNSNSNTVNNTTNNGSGPPGSNNHSNSPPSRDNSSSRNQAMVENDENAASADQSTQSFLLNTTTSMSTYTNIISTYNTGSSVTGSNVFYTNSSNNNSNTNTNTSNNSSSTPMPCSPIEGSNSSYMIALSSQQPAPSSNQQFGYFTGAGSHQTVIMTDPSSDVSGNMGQQPQQPVTSSGTLGKSSLTSTSSGVGHDMGIDCGRLTDDITSSGFGGLLMDLNSYIVEKSDPPTISSTSPSTISSSSFISSTNESQHQQLHLHQHHQHQQQQQHHQPHLLQQHLNYTTSTSNHHTVLPPVSTFLLPNFRDHSWWGSDRGMIMKQPNPYGTGLLPVNHHHMDSNHQQDLNCELLDCGDEEKGEREYSRSPSTLTSLTTASLSH